MPKPDPKSQTMHLRTLLSMACDGVGPSMTCINLLRGMRAAGVGATLYVNRSRIPIEDIPHRNVLPGPLARLPYRYVSAIASRRSEARFLAELSGGDVAYLWPSASLHAHHVAAERGVPIILEGINTRMGHAKTVLDAEYARLGLAAGHDITEARIAEEDEKLSLATAIFAPSPGVEAALAGHVPHDRILSSSYGVSLADFAVKPVPPEPQDRPLRFLFVGYACVRKGVHRLLDAWAAAGGPGELILAGAIEPAIATHCAAHLDRPDVRTPGFVRDVAALYEQADVFVLPSLEEGDPLVTYEAAAHGLPLIVSPSGTGRIAAQGQGAVMVDPYESETLVAAFRRCVDLETRRSLSEQARAAAETYDWSAVGAQRAALLRKVQPTPDRGG